MSVLDTILDRSRDPFEAAARRFESPTAATDLSPLALGMALDKRLVRTPALDLVDDAVRDWVTGKHLRTIVVMAPQEGKGLDVQTPIPTPTGWTAMGDLTPGDRVIGGDGQPCTVTFVSPPRRLDCYRVTFQDGSTLIADGDHRWRVWDRSGYDPARYAAATGTALEKANAGRRSWKVVDTRELARDPGRYSVPTQPVMALPDRDDLTLPPYVLGVWLGDGTTSGAGLTCADDEIVKEVAGEGWPVRRMPNCGPYAWTWARPAGDPDRGGFLRALRALDVLDNKHIPTAYLRGSYDQRLALLQGLMDTDGTCYFNGTGYSACEYASTKEPLARAVLQLVRSVGIRAYIRESRATLDGRYISQVWNVKFTTDVPVFRLSRKLERLYGVDGPRKIRLRIGVKHVEPVPTVTTRCITVDSPDATYLAGHDLVVTHNTTEGRYGCLQGLRYDPYLRFGVASYSDRIARRVPRWVRNDATSFPGLGLRLAPDQRAAHDWRLENGIGGMYAAGVGGSWSGMPIDRLLVDDVFKDRTDADSEASRDTVKDWWKSTATARLSEGGAVLIINTRWHHDDLIGWLLDTDPAGWRVVHIPAQADPEVSHPDPLGRRPGEFMVSARGRTQASWEKRKREADDEWEPVYQGNPVKPGGKTFDVDRLRRWRLSSDGRWIDTGNGGPRWQLAECYRFATIDTATSTSSSADWTVASAWAVPPDGTLVLLDVRRDRVPEHEQLDLARPLVEAWALEMLWVESTMAGTRLVRSAVAEGLRVDDLKADRSKPVRAALAARWVKEGRVWWPLSDPRIEASVEPLGGTLLKELKQFPTGRHDDFVDTLAYAAAVAWEQYLPPHSPAPPTPDHGSSVVERAAAGVPGGDLMSRAL